MIYLDSSALLKLVIEEPESAAIATWLADRSDDLPVSSELAKLEVVRAARRLKVNVATSARSLMSQLDLIPIDSVLINEAAEVGPLLGGLDAIHLASALSIRADLTAFVAYDHRLVSAAEADGIEVSRPGVSVS